MTTFTFPYRRDAETTNLLDALEDLEAPAEVTLGPGADLQYADLRGANSPAQAAPALEPPKPPGSMSATHDVVAPNTFSTAMSRPPFNSLKTGFQCGAFQT